MKEKVVVAMSGGVDSSVAAVLLKDQGFDVIGVTMQIWPQKKSSGSCCSLEAINDARKVADKIGIPYYVMNFREEFKKQVIDDFINEYKNGRTPNPCIRCNEFIKFQHLLQKAKELGAEYVATGHYARIALPACRQARRITRYALLKGKDNKKDQSYALYTLNQDNLKHILFPLGDLTKEEVRKIAKKKGLPVHDKEESQEICFIEDDDYNRFLKENAPEVMVPGDIVDTKGKVVGKHQGVAFYTIGQRKGIGAHKAEPKYVIKIDPKKHQIVIGDKIDTLGSELEAHKVTFVDGECPKTPLEIMAKIRYNSIEAPATLAWVKGNKAKVMFLEPQNAITPGQSVVFYKGEEVIGGGIIR